MSNIKVTDIINAQYWIDGVKKNVVRIYAGVQKIWENIKEIITDRQNLSAAKYNDKYLRYNCDFSNCTDLTNSFNDNRSIVDLVLDGTSNVKVWGAGDRNGAFSNCPNLTTIKLSTDNATLFDGTFDSTWFNNPKLTSIEFSTTKNVTNFHSAFRSCNNLSSLKGVDFSSCVGYDAMFYRDGYQGISNLKIFTAKNFGKQKDLDSAEPYGFNCLVNWGIGSTEAHNSVYDTLYTYSYNRTANGFNTITVKLSKNTMSILTVDEKAAITAKGYTLTT